MGDLCHHYLLYLAKTFRVTNPVKNYALKYPPIIYYANDFRAQVCARICNAPTPVPAISYKARESNLKSCN